MSCPGLTQGDAFLTGALNVIDCQAQTIGESGYRALAAPGSTAALALTSALVIFVALAGYRMLFGARLRPEDAVIALVKIGVVMMLATSWPAYRTIVYDVTMRGPAELAGEVGGAASLPGAGGGLVAWLQSIDNGLLILSELGTGTPDAPVAAPVVAAGEVAATPLSGPRPGWDSIDAREQVGKARTVFLAATIGVFSIVRRLAGLLLAVGPLFAIFLLFRGTQGLFEGWVRALVGVLIAAFSTAIILGAQLALVSPWLTGIVATRLADQPTPGVAIELYVTMLAFALALLAALVVSTRVGLGFRLPAFGATIGTAEPSRAPAGRLADSPAGRLESSSRAPALDRADQIAAAVQSTQRREQVAATIVTAPPPPRSAAPNDRQSEDSTLIAAPIGRSYQRRTQRRVSALASQRNTI